MDRLIQKSGLEKVEAESWGSFTRRRERTKGEWPEGQQENRETKTGIARYSGILQSKTKADGILKKHLS